MNKHHGGTLLGFLIGLLVGLGAALAVAVYVTKVPIPLVDRGVQRDASKDVVEAERNKTWNPNANLGGKTTPQPATTDNTAASAPATPAPPAPTPQASPSPDPLGALIQAQTQSPGKVATVEAADPFIYFVQAGAFRNAPEAEAQRAKLAMQGFDAKVSEREQAGRAVYRVRVGPFDKKPDADAMQSRMNELGVETALVRVQR